MLHLRARDFAPLTGDPGNQLNNLANPFGGFLQARDFGAGLRRPIHRLVHRDRNLPDLPADLGNARRQLFRGLSGCIQVMTGCVGATGSACCGVAGADCGFGHLAGLGFNDLRGMR
jgi:hypothetical protein